MDHENKIGIVHSEDCTYNLINGQFYNDPEIWLRSDSMSLISWLHTPLVRDRNIAMIIN